MERLSGDYDTGLFAPGIGSPAAESSEPGLEARDLVERIMNGDREAIKGLREVAEAAERGDHPVDVDPIL